MEWLDRIITIVCSLLASSGLWAFLQSRWQKKHDQNDLLLGLAHDRIMELGGRYIERGYIYADEYENLYTYLYVPYKNRGGNGTAKLIVEKVQKLEVRRRDDFG